MRRLLAAALLLLAVPAAPRAALPRPDERPSPNRRTPIVAAVEKVRGAVVNVSAEEIVRIRVPTRADSMAELLFGDLFERPRYRRGYQVTSLGSGVIASPDGYVLTNAHVVERGARFRIGLLDGRELLAKVVKAGDRTLFDFIQTDTSIDPGNSGGALLDIEGRLVGVNTAILGDRNAGIGFAIPIDRARRIAEDLIAHGEVPEGYVGVSVGDVPARQGGPDAASGGVLVTAVEPRSPGERAGVRRGDQIVSVQGFEPSSAEEFRFRVRDLGSARRIAFEFD